MAPHSSTLAWKIPWTEEPGGLQSMGSLRVGHDWAPSLSLFIFMHWRRKWQPTPVFLSGESQGQRSLVAAIYGVTQSRTRLKRLSSSSSSWNSLAFFWWSNGCWQFNLWFLCLFKNQLERLEVHSSCILKPGLENFKHYFTSLWDECNCVVVWTFFGIAFI